MFKDHKNFQMFKDHKNFQMFKDYKNFQSVFRPEKKFEDPYPIIHRWWLIDPNVFCCSSKNDNTNIIYFFVYVLIKNILPYFVVSFNAHIYYIENLLSPLQKTADFFSDGDYRMYGYIEWIFNMTLIPNFMFFAM